MSTQSNRTLCQGFLQKVLNEGKLALTPAFIAAGSVQHEHGDVPRKYQGGPRAVAEFIGLYRRAFPDLHLKIEDQMAENDRVVTRFRFEGTQTGPLMGIAASGQRVSVEGIRIDRIENGKIAESWMQWDLLHLLEQVGALPNLSRQPELASEPAEAPVAQVSPAVALAA
ncbi:MAG TPA: ester cyclase [Thermoanaerobaculia bacterium]|nr:ester cyclase [Thermoanaerobaculia bacterium]